MDNAIALLIAGVMAGVSAFAITYMIRYTDGPFDIFAHYRRLVGLETLLMVGDVYNKETDQWIEDPEPDRFFAKLTACFWCFTTWISLPITLLVCTVFGFDDVLTFVLLWVFAIGVSGRLQISYG